MMAVDTSALMAVVLKERHATACSAALQSDSNLVISAVTLAEALVVAAGKNVASEMDRFLDVLGCKVVEASAATAGRVIQIYRTWGKGWHPAGLNFGDCFAYDTARTQNCPPLFVGEDFRRTDIISVL